MATIPISMPAIPFVGFIPGGLSIGRSIRISGQMSHGGDRFAINVQRGPSVQPRDNCSIHLSIRPFENAIVRNHYTNHQWGTEERHGGCPIQHGGHFEILISAEPAFFKISINGTHFSTFNYRLPVFGNSQYIAIDGTCTVSYIGFETGSTPHQPPHIHMTPTPYVQVAQPPAVIHVHHHQPPPGPPSHHFPHRGPHHIPPRPPHHRHPRH